MENTSYIITNIISNIASNGASLPAFVTTKEAILINWDFQCKDRIV